MSYINQMIAPFSHGMDLRSLYTTLNSSYSPPGQSGPTMAELLKKAAESAQRQGDTVEGLQTPGAPEEDGYSAFVQIVGAALQKVGVPPDLIRNSVADGRIIPSEALAILGEMGRHLPESIAPSEADTRAALGTAAMYGITNPSVVASLARFEAGAPGMFVDDPEMSVPTAEANKSRPTVSSPSPVPQ